VRIHQTVFLTRDYSSAPDHCGNQSSNRTHKCPYTAFTVVVPLHSSECCENIRTSADSATRAHVKTKASTCRRCFRPPGITEVPAVSAFRQRRISQKNWCWGVATHCPASMLKVPSHDLSRDLVAAGRRHIRNFFRDKTLRDGLALVAARKLNARRTE